LYENKIGILGLGGVGGYFGGLLAKAYFESDAIEIVLLHVAKPKSYTKNGLKIIADTTEIVAFLV
jgi:2-dehydropantoate 2-reductase